MQQSEKVELKLQHGEEDGLEGPTYVEIRISGFDFYLEVQSSGESNFGMRSIYVGDPSRAACVMETLERFVDMVRASRGKSVA